MVDNGGIWDEQSFRTFEINRDRDYIRKLEKQNKLMLKALEDLRSNWDGLSDDSFNIIDEVLMNLEEAKNESRD